MTPLDPGILDDILANPDSDDLRLIAADFWTDQGEHERAEFVRVQVELVSLKVKLCTPCERGECLPPCDRAKLRRRERKLLTRHQWSWMGVAIEQFAIPAHAAGKPIPCPWTFRRGFVEAITLAASLWVATADVLTAAAPIREVTLQMWPDQLWMIGDRLGIIWPRIKFNLPATHEDFSATTGEEIADEIIDNIGLGNHLYLTPATTPP